MAPRAHCASADARVTGDPVLKAQVACASAAQLIEQEKAREALATISAAEAVVAAPEHADVAAYRARLESRAAQRAGDVVRAVRAAERAVELETRRSAPPNRALDSLRTLAMARSSAGDYAGADAAYRRAAVLVEQEGLDDTLDYAVLLNNWSVVMQRAGQHRTSAALSKRAVDIARRADSEQGASLTMLSTLASALTAIGDFGGATVAVDESLVKARAAGSATRLFNTLGQAVIAATEGGDVARAAQFLTEAERALNSGLTAAAGRRRRNLRRARRAGERQSREAVNRARRALELLAAASSSPSSLLPTQTFLARSLNASGRFNEALEFAEKSLAQSREGLGGFRYSSTVGSALLEQATAHRGLGHIDAARAAVTQAIEHLNDALGLQSTTTVRAQRLHSALTNDTR